LPELRQLRLHSQALVTQRQDFDVWFFINSAVIFHSFPQNIGAHN